MIRSLVYILLVTVFLFIVAELFSRFVVKPCEWPKTFYDNRNKILKYEPNQQGVFRFGPSNIFEADWQTNDEGWLSSFSYKNLPQKSIAIIGDSYVAGLHVKPEERFSSLLQSKLKDKVVLNFGISGTPLSNYLKMTTYVQKHYKPTFIILVICWNDYDESFFNKKTSLTGFTYFDKKLNLFNTDKKNSYLKKFAFKSFFVKNLIEINKLTRNYFASNSANQNITHFDEFERQKILEYFLEINKITGKNILFVFTDPLSNNFITNPQMMYNNSIHNYISCSLYQSNPSHTCLIKFRKNNGELNRKFDPHWDALENAQVSDQIYKKLLKVYDD